MSRQDTALLADFYELTMLQAYYLQNMNGIATFEFFVRQLPAERNFLLAAGLQQAVEYLRDLHFSEQDLEWMHACQRFAPNFVESLRSFGFTGDVDALPEGSVFFADEPVLRVTAPLREAQFIESRVINLLHYQIAVASKAARCVLAAAGKRLVDFGLRRSHGAEAGVLSARASYLAGFDGTATTLAAREFGIPVFGTMAHSYIQAHEYEVEAFAPFAYAFPNDTTLLIDTYDTEAAAKQVVLLAQRLREKDDIHIKAVRIDSGDLGTWAGRVRRILDCGGCPDISILVSGNLDEHAIAKLVVAGAPIDAFGVGTRMNTSSDAPYLDCAYKLVEYEGRPCRKRSLHKANWPGRKQIFRRYAASHSFESDVLGLADEDMSGEPQLEPVMRSGQPVRPLPTLQEIRQRARREMQSLPSELQGREHAASPMPRISARLQELAKAVDQRQQAHAAEEASRWRQ